MDQPFSAYRGDQSYVFVCYAHEDSDRVYPEIRRLHETGVRLWYDEGISPGTRWSDTLAEALERASLVLFFCTPASVASPHCNDEIAFALDQDLPIVTIRYGAFELPPGLKLRLGAHQAILTDSLSPAQFEARLDAAITRWVDEEQVRPEQPKLAPAVQPPSGGHRKAWLAGVSVLVAIAAIAAVIGWWATSKDVPDVPEERGPIRLAVLPFRAVGGEDGGQEFAALLTETLIGELSGDTLEPLKNFYPTLKSRGWTVAPYTAVLRFSGSTKDPSTIAQELGVEVLIGGSVRMEDDDRVRVNAELLDVRRTEQMWAQTLSYSQDDSEIETIISRDIAFGAIEAMPMGEWYAATRYWFKEPRAWEYYVKAARLYLSMPGPPFRQEIIENYERAWQLEPDFLYTLEGLIHNYHDAYRDRLDPIQTIESMDVLISRLEALAPLGLPSDEGRLLRSAASIRAILAYLQFDFEAASRHLEDVLDQDPNQPSGLVLLAEFELHRGEFDAALRIFQRSVIAGASVPAVLNTVAELQLGAGRPRAAVDYVDEMLAFARADYGRGRLLLTKAEALQVLGDTNAALNMIAEADHLLATTHPAAIAAALANAGDTDRARDLLSRADQGKISDAATLKDLIRGYIALGEFEAAARLSDEAIRARHVPTIVFLRASIDAFEVDEEPSWIPIRQALDALPSPAQSDARFSK